MDDLAGIDWTKPAPKQNPTPLSTLPSYRQNPTPQLSGRSTPLSAQQSGSLSISSRGPTPAPKAATSSNDSFAGLVSLNSSKGTPNTLSLQERQKQLLEEKAKQEAERRKQYDSTFGGQDSKFWDSLGSGKSTPQQLSINPPPANLSGGSSLSRTINKPFSNLNISAKQSQHLASTDDDLLSAFSSGAEVDISSHFPPPASLDSGRSTPAVSGRTSSNNTPAPQPLSSNALGDDDDIFGLGSIAQKRTLSPSQSFAPSPGDEDILGLLGKPVSEFKKVSSSEPTSGVPLPEREQSPSIEDLNPQDRAVADLVDMGFDSDKAAIALAMTESGTNVQAAVSIILNQAHADAKSKTQERHSPDEHHDHSRRRKPQSSTRDSSTGGSTPAWMRGQDSRSQSAHRHQDNNSPGQEKDVSQYAQEIGSSLFKSANSLWKSGQKKVQKAVADFQQEGDPNVPKWMRNAQTPEDNVTKASRRANSPKHNTNVTDEALMLDTRDRPAKPRPSNSRDADPLAFPQRDAPTGRSNGVPDRITSQSPSFQQQLQQQDKRPAANLTRQDIEERSAQAYTSPARRKKANPNQDFQESRDPTISPAPTRQPVAHQSNNPFAQRPSAPKSRGPAVTLSPPKSRAPPRQVPSASSSILSSSAAYRQKGSEAFKRGDYSAAHAAYSAALSPLPPTHPVTIIVLCNLAVTNIKVGDPKAAVSNADAALAIIGISKGDGEKITLGGTEGEKEMKEFFGKALMRKAEALEHMEKWADAGKVWKEAVENGVGGSISIQGRNRCDKAVGKTASLTTIKKPPVRKPPPPKPSALSDLGGGTNAEAESVKRLRAANAAAEKADDEKFALNDSVEAKLVAWKGTKSDNLRALLGSLDKVLWPEAGWNKVNMGDLVIPNKVKIVYMKAIAKVHPDKISQTASTEQRMISAAVFSTLNEAWDKFKKDNNL